MTQQIIIGLIPTALILLLIAYLLKKGANKIDFFKGRKLLKNVVIIGSTLIFYLIVLNLTFSYLLKVPSEKFDELSWKEDTTIRYKMIDDLIKSDYLLNKNKVKVKEIFGEPIRITTDQNTWDYDLVGRTWADFKITTLRIQFKDNVVYKFESFPKE